MMVRVWPATVLDLHRKFAVTSGYEQKFVATAN